MDRIEAHAVSTQVTPLSPEAAARLDSLFRLYSASVTAFAARFAHRPADVDDIAATAWLLATRYLGGLRADDDHAMAWLRSVTRTAARDFYRPRRQGEWPSDWTDAMTSRRLPASPPADSAADVDALALLTPAQAVVIKLKAQGLSDLRIARRLGRSEAAIRKRKHAGRRNLRASLAMAG